MLDYLAVYHTRICGGKAVLAGRYILESEQFVACKNCERHWQKSM
jgi:hypothetical protein